MISHANSNESNNLNTPNSDYVKRTSNFAYYTVKNGISSNTLITLPKRNDTDSSAYINNGRIYLNHIIEEIPSLQSSSEIIDHAHDDSGTNLVNTEKLIGCHMYPF